MTQQVEIACSELHGPKDRLCICCKQINGENVIQGIMLQATEFRRCEQA